jgi:Fe-S oxidoreductase
MSDKPVSYMPTDGLTYDPSEAKYWDRAALDKELTRTYEICHGCRMCFKFCDSFPTLFDLIDNQYDGDVRRITEADTDHIMDQCFQCKLCEVQCPYTVRDGHEYQLDFPRLAHRHTAVRAKEKGIAWRDRILSQPDRAAAMARASFGIANAMNKVSIHRQLMEKALGVHRDKLLPDFAPTTFESWAARQGLMVTGEAPEAVLFQTCYVQNNEPEIGRDTVDVLQKSQVDVKCVKGLQCCGMPAWEKGDLDAVRRQARNNLDILLPLVEKGSKVLAINPTCSMMMRREYPELLEGVNRERARRLAEAVMDPGEFLWSIRKEDRFNTDFKSSPGPTVAYHAPCHLRAQGIGFKGRDLIKKIPGVSTEMTLECCGHDGTYAMSVKGFEPSQRVGAKAFGEMQGREAEVWSTDCPLAALQFQQHAGKKPLHPMSILARAYRENGFPHKIEPEDDASPEGTS